MTSAAAVVLLDLLLKSILILAIFVFLDRLVTKRLPNNSLHLLWLNSILCLVLLPFLPSVIPATAMQTSTEPWFEVVVTPTSIGNVSPTNIYSWLGMLYFIPTAWLIGRMASALLRLRHIQNASTRIEAPRHTQLLAELARQLNISRTVTLSSSVLIDSPLSYGLLRPKIILPAQSAHWSSDVMTDVLLHELSHIRRLDWLTMLLAWFIAAMYWANPLVWYAIKRINEESEHSCDSAVLHAGRSDTGYAESLLSVVKACRHSTQRTSRLPAQKMLDRNTLKNRIHHILENTTMTASKQKWPGSFKVFASLTLIISAAIVLGVGGSHLVSAQTQDSQPSPSQRAVTEEMYPINEVRPMYPTRAAQRGIEGWVHLEFTVTATGSVDPESIVVLEADPPGIFDSSALRATAELMFSPRMVNGSSVDVPKVQYVWRYFMSEQAAQ